MVRSNGFQRLLARAAELGPLRLTLAIVVVATAMAEGVALLTFEVMAGIPLADFALPVALTAMTVAAPIGYVLSRTIDRAVQGEQALARREQQLRETQRIARLGHWRLDIERQRLDWSEEVFAILGADPAGGEPSLDAYLDRIAPADRGRTRQAFEQLVASGGCHELEYTITGFDGAERILWLDGRRETDAAGRVVAIYGACQDVSERRRTEQALFQSQKMEAVGQLTGGVAHDFNNLLQALDGCLSMVQRRVADPQALATLEAGRRTVGRGARLVRQLTAFARRQPLRPQAVRPDALVSGMAELLRPSLGDRVRVEFDLPPDLWPIHADPTHMELALLNLAVNSRDAMPEGGTIRIAAANAVLAPGEDPSGLSGDFVRVSVADTGGGMTEAVLARIFEPFFTTKEPGRGTGLGLAMVYGFARQSGGAVRAASAPGRGTTVTLLLPRAPASAPAAEAAPRPARGAAGGTVLVVEDNPAVAEAAVGLLAELGYNALRAEGPAEALAILRAGRAVDAVLSDVVMPGGSGLELADRLRRERPDLPVVLATGYSEAAETAAGGPWPLLQKPYSADDLAAALHAQSDRAARPPG